MKSLFAITLSLLAANALAQEKPQYSQLGALGAILRFEPIPVAKKVTTKVLTATPSQLAVGAATVYAGYKTLQFVGNNPMIAGSILTLAYVLTNFIDIENYIKQDPENAQKMYNWLDGQKLQHPNKIEDIDKLQNRVISASM